MQILNNALGSRRSHSSLHLIHAANIKTIFELYIECVRSGAR